MIKVLFFAHLRDLANTDQIDISSDGITHVRDLLTALKQIMPAELIEALQDETAMVSVNHKYAGWDAELNDGVEVGILPPVSGG